MENFIEKIGNKDAPFLKRFVFSLALVVFAGLSTAHAGLVTYNFTGVATSQTGVFAGQGSAVNGSIFFDSNLQDTVVASTTLDIFQTSNSSNINLVIGATITNGVFSESYNVLGGGIGSAFFDVSDSTIIDFFDFGLSKNGTSLSLSLVDQGNKNLVLPGTGGLTGAVPDLTTFSLGSITSQFNEVNLSDNISKLRFDVTSFSAPVSQIPTPGVLPLLIIGVVGLGFASRRKRGKTVTA